MKKLLAPVLATLALAAGTIGTAAAQVNVGVSIGIHQPGVYGRIEIGNLPPPPVYYPQPVVYAPTPVAVYQRPIYLYVQPGHQRDWGRYCGRYGACGQPVYFVQETWVRERYEHEHPHWDRDDRDDRGDRGRGHGRGHDKHGDR